MLSRLHGLPTVLAFSSTAKHVEKIHTFHLFLTPSRRTCQSFHSWGPGKFVVSPAHDRVEVCQGLNSTTQKVAINLLAEIFEPNHFASHDPRDGILKYALTFYLNISESIWNILTFCLIHWLRTLRMVSDTFSDILSDKISRTYSLLTYDRACYVIHLALSLTFLSHYLVSSCIICKGGGGGGLEWEKLT